MDQADAQYPFLQSAREAVEQADVDLVEVVTHERQVVERALDRVERSLTENTVGDPHRRPRVELLSYPVARVLVSLVDEHILTRNYTRAEAATAHERIERELTRTTELQSRQRERLTIDSLLAEFDITDAVRESPTADDEYRVAVGTYLAYGSEQWGDEWRLVNRDLQAGEIPLEERELLVLVRHAIRQRIAEGLPLSVPEVIATQLESEVATLREQLAELELMRDIDTVVPDLFPPCMTFLLDQVQKGEHIEHHSRFAIASFLTSIGMTTDEIVDLFEVNPGFGEEVTRYQVDHIRGSSSPTEYSPPSCATMQSYGDCVNMDDLCEQISHPLGYYEKQLDNADEDELVDWREQQSQES